MASSPLSKTQGVNISQIFGILKFIQHAYGLIKHCPQVQKGILPSNNNKTKITKNNHLKIPTKQKKIIQQTPPNKTKTNSSLILSIIAVPPNGSFTRENLPCFCSLLYPKRLQQICRESSSMKAQQIQ